MAVGVGDDEAVVAGVVNGDDVGVVGELGADAGEVGLGDLEGEEADADVVVRVGLAGGGRVRGLGDP